MCFFHTTIGGVYISALKDLTITHKFVGWVEQKPIRKSTEENDFQDSKDLKPSKYK